MQAFAATKVGTLAPGDQAKSYAYYKALRHCFDVGAFKNSVIVPPLLETKNRDMSQQNAIDFEWFHGYSGITAGSPTPNSTTVGVVNEPDDGDANCGDSEGSAWIKNAATLWGYSSGPALLCALGFTREVNGGACTNTPSGATNNFKAPSDVSARLDKFWTDTLGGGSTGVKSITDQGGLYRLYLDSFMAACRPSSGGSDYTIQTFAEGSSTPTATKYAASDRDRTKSYEVRVAQWNTMTCGELAKAIGDPKSDVVLGYIRYLKANDGKDDSANDQWGCSSTPDAPECQGDARSSCVIDGVGWIVCSVAVFLANVTDQVYELVKMMLEIPPVNVDVSDGTNGVYNAWQIMRTIANVLFIIAFLVIVFSQLSSTGVSNYGVKKLLPRLVICAILVNLSYWIGAIAVDLSNIVGSGIYDLFASAKERMNIGISANWGDIIAGLLAGSALAVTGTAAAGAVVAVAGSAAVAAGSSGILAIIMLALPMLLGAVLAVLIVAFLLIARQALVVILIMISPLAFVAMLFPNTERHYKKWFELLLTMLIMFPMVSVIFGGAQVAGLAILSTAVGMDDPLTTGLAIITGQLVIVLPFFFLFTLIGKFSGSQLTSMAGKLRASGMKAIGGVKKLTNPVAQRKMNLAKTRLQTGDVRRRYNRRGKETLGSRLGGASAGLVGGTLNAMGQSKHIDETYIKAGQTDIQRGYEESAAGQAADHVLKTAQLEAKTAETTASARFEASAPMSLKQSARLADEQLKVQKAATTRAGVEASTLYAQGVRTGDAAKLAEAASRVGGDLSIAHGLHDAHTTASVTGEATNIAARLQQQEYAAQILQPNSALVGDASGIGGPRAESSVRASAQSVVSEATTKAIAAEKTLLGSTSPAELEVRYADPALSDEARAAALGRLLQVGTDDQIHNALDYVASQHGTTSGTTLQQQFVADIGSRKPLSLGGGALSQLQTGTFAGTFQSEVASRLTGGKIAAAGLAGASKDELAKILGAVRAMPVKGPELEKLRDNITDHLLNKNITPPTPEVAKLMEEIAREIP